jgi:hypothetical protein
MANLANIEGDVPILGLDHFVQAHILREEPDHSLSMLYGRRRSVYLTWVLDCTLVKVLYCSLIGWERCATASQDHLGLMGELAWRQHSRPRLHHRVTLRSPSGVDQAKHAVEGIRRLERRMDDFAHMQTEMQASIDSQASMMHDLFGHFRINPDAKILQRYKLGGGGGCLGMSPHSSCFVPSFSSYLVTCLARWSYHYRCHEC